MEELLRINTPEELYTYMTKNIKYGFKTNINDKLYIRKELNNDELYENTLFNHYYLQTPEELLISKCGICYDQVELERIWFISHGYKVHTYYMDYHNHSFLAYEKDNKYSILECTIKQFNGIFEGDTLMEVINKYIDKQKEGKDFIINIYEYEEVPFGTNFNSLINYFKIKEQTSI